MITTEIRKLLIPGYDSSVESHTISGRIFILVFFDQRDEIISPICKEQILNRIQDKAYVQVMES